MQIGLLPEPITVDLSFLAFRELAWLGSHGMAAHAFPRLLDLVGSGTLRPDQLITRVIGLDARSERPGRHGAKSVGRRHRHSSAASGQSA